MTHDLKKYKSVFVANALISPFNTHTMHIKSFYTQQNCYAFPKNLIPWRDSNPGLLGCDVHCATPPGQIFFVFRGMPALRQAVRSWRLPPRIRLQVGRVLRPRDGLLGQKQANETQAVQLWLVKIGHLNVQFIERSINFDPTESMEYCVDYCRFNMI
jgi:hypothetical protein